jgi:hypothetical protein
MEAPSPPKLKSWIGAFNHRGQRGMPQVLIFIEFVFVTNIPKVDMKRPWLYLFGFDEKGTPDFRVNLILYSCYLKVKKLFQVFPCSCQCELSVFHSFCTDQPVSDYPDILCFAFDYYGFETIMLIKMYVHRRNYQVVVKMLKVGKVIGKFSDIVGIDQGYDSHGFGA